MPVTISRQPSPSANSSQHNSQCRIGPFWYSRTSKKLAIFPPFAKIFLPAHRKGTGLAMGVPADLALHVDPRAELGVAEPCCVSRVLS